MPKQRKVAPNQGNLENSEAASTAVAETPEAPENLTNEAPQAVKPYPDREASSDGVERITFKVVAGKIDPEGIRKSNEARVREAIQQSIKDPKFREWAKLDASATPGLDAANLVPPSLVGDMLDLAVNIEALVLSKKSGMAYPEVRKILAWSLDEHERLDRQGARLAVKYIPMEWLEKVDLWLFIASIVSLSSIKIQMLNAHTKASFERTVNAEPLKQEPPKQPEPPKITGEVDALSSFKPKEKPESNGMGESFG